MQQTEFSSDFLKYRAPLSSASNAAYPSYDGNDFGGYKSSNNPVLEQPSSWLQGSDFNSMAGDLFTAKPAHDDYMPKANDFSYANLSGINLNLDQIKIVSSEKGGRR